VTDEQHLALKFKEIKTRSGKKSIEATLVGNNGKRGATREIGTVPTPAFSLFLWHV
jgi:hypothetical protein